MLHIQGKIERNVFVAFSGGVDSVAVADFLKRNHNITLVHVNHGNDIASQEQAFVEQFAVDQGISLHLYKTTEEKPRDESWEEHWRNERYKVFRKVPGPVITCHHLDDCVETWLWNMCNGRDHTIPYSHLNVIRPFRTSRKSEFIDWCSRKQLKWYEDPTNANPHFAVRNFIRHTMVPAALQVNPGIHTTIRNKLLQEKI